MTLKEIARESGLSQQTILSYINKGLISPDKENGKYVFSAGDLQRLYQIASMQDFGATKEEIHERYKKEISPFDKAIRNLKRLHSKKNWRIAGVVLFFALIIFMYWWLNFRPIQLTYTISDATLAVPTKSSDSHLIQYYLSQDSNMNLPDQFYVCSKDQNLYNSITAAGYKTFSEVIITIKIPIKDAIRFDYRITNELELDPDKVNSKVLISRNRSKDYVRVLSVKE